ncbi:MAG TPA: PIN domain-containing protein [Longimicrobiales bacterium]|nr:PIN domain-containing protein [Longimicrobiales bacterium]
MADPLDTNVILRYLVEDPETIAPRFRGVLPFFEKLERGERSALLTALVLFQCWFVLTTYYGVPGPDAAAKLRELLAFKGLHVPEKPVLRACLDTLLADRSADVVDAYLAALCSLKGLAGVYSFDQGLSRLGVELLPVE